MFQADVQVLFGRTTAEAGEFQVYDISGGCKWPWRYLRDIATAVGLMPLSTMRKHGDASLSLSDVLVSSTTRTGNLRASMRLALT